MQFHKWEVCIGTYVCATTYLSRDSPLPLTVSFANCLSVFAQSVKQPSEFPCSTDFSIIIHALLLIITPFNKTTRRERKKIYFYLNKIYRLLPSLDFPNIFLREQSTRRDQSSRKKESNRSNLRLVQWKKKKKEEEEFRFPLLLNRKPSYFRHSIRPRSTQKESIGY